MPKCEKNVEIRNKRNKRTETFPRVSDSFLNIDNSSKLSVEPDQIKYYTA